MKALSQFDLGVEQFVERIPGRIDHAVVAVDSHTAGEATRVVIAAPQQVQGSTLAEKREFLMANGDTLRRQLTYEPRGHRDLVVAVVTEPTTADSAFGLIFMDSRRFPYACGTATIGAVATLVELGLIEAAQDASIRIDTPAGVATTRIVSEQDGGISVRLMFPPAFVNETGHRLRVDGAELQVDTVFVGGFLAVVSAAELGVAIAPQHERELAAKGMALLDAANEQIEVRHPQRPEVRTIDGVVVTADATLSRSAVIYGDAHVDRSPCGTGTVAKMALLNRRGLLDVGVPFVSEGLLGTRFDGRIVEQCVEAGLQAICGQITGRAHLTGVHQFLVDPTDVLGAGFVVRSS